MFIRPTPRGTPTSYLQQFYVLVYVYEKYRKYLPLYAHTMAAAYPNVKFLVVTSKKDNKKIQKLIHQHNLEAQIKLLIDEELIAKDFKFLLCHKHNHVRPSLRWLFNLEKYIGNTDDIYIGDVDFFIIPESPALPEYHKNTLTYQLYQFDNARRGNSFLTGLHFVNHTVYKSYRNLNANDIKDLLKKYGPQGFDERLLQHLSKRETNFEIKDLETWRPYHGYHFAQLRLREFYRADHRHHVAPDGKLAHNAYPRFKLFRTMREMNTANENIRNAIESLPLLTRILFKFKLAYHRIFP